MHLSPAQSRRALIFASLLFLPPTLIIGIWLAQYGGFAFEPPLMHAVHAHAGTWFDPIATVLHYLGKTAIAVPLIGAVAAALYFADKKREALFCVLAALVPTLNMLIVKVWFARERPLLWPRLIEESNFSFPSGHSTFSAAVIAFGRGNKAATAQITRIIYTGNGKRFVANFVFERTQYADSSKKPAAVEACL